MSIEISVRPVPGGWTVASSFGQALMFISGGRAERAAVALAQAAAAAGDQAEVLIHTRDGRLAGRRWYTPALNLVREVQDRALRR